MVIEFVQSPDRETRYAIPRVPTAAFYETENAMFAFIDAFLLGTVSGLRAFLGLAFVSWAARLGYLRLDHTWLAFLGFAFTPYILSLMAVAEFVIDQLPKTPSRLILPQFIPRIVTGALCGLAVGLSLSQVVAGALFGILGSIVGTLGGAKARSFGAKLFGRDLPAALTEDAIAIGVAVSAITLLP
jgi:uncharacterized membrane protein